MKLDVLIEENTNLIWKIANMFYGIDKNDLFQAGALGVAKAYRNYQKNGDTKFSTYAYEYIYGEMYQLANNKNIKVSKDVLKLYKLIEKTRYALAQKWERIPTNEELAMYLEMEPEKIDLAVSSAMQIMSLDDDNKESRNLHEVIAQEESISQDDKIMLNNSLEMLNPVEKDIINSRYYEDLTQSETARKLGLTQVMVSRYEKKSLNKMREYMYM